MVVVKNIKTENIKKHIKYISIINEFKNRL